MKRYNHFAERTAKCLWGWGRSLMPQWRAMQDHSQGHQQRRVFRQGTAHDTTLRNWGSTSFLPFSCHRWQQITIHFHATGEKLKQIREDTHFCLWNIFLFFLSSSSSLKKKPNNPPPPSPNKRKQNKTAQWSTFTLKSASLKGIL